MAFAYVFYGAAGLLLLLSLLKSRDKTRTALAAQRKAGELSDGEILAGLRKHNYISRNAEAEYAVAIRSLYARQC
jgi:hypothetical protein